MRASLPILAFAAAAAIPACTDPGSSPIEVRTGDATVTGTSFVCTGSWPSAITPCQAPWDSVAAARAFVPATGGLEIALVRDPIPVDGGASVPSIALQLDPYGVVLGADAYEATTRAGDVQTVERSGSIGGYVLPVAVSTDPTQRNAGSFEIDFAWGTIEGTYDTATP